MTFMTSILSLICFFFLMDNHFFFQKTKFVLNLIVLLVLIYQEKTVFYVMDLHTRRFVTPYPMVVKNKLWSLPFLGMVDHIFVLDSLDW